MRRLQSDIVPLLKATAEGTLKDTAPPQWTQDAALCVVMAANGYPGPYPKDTEIQNINKAEALENVVVFHAGTKTENGKILSNGGRVLGVTALGTTVAAAQKHAYQAVDAITWPEGFCRRDIGWRAIKHRKTEEVA